MATTSSSTRKPRTRRHERALVRDGIQAYMETIRKYPILDREEEQVLAHRYVNEEDEAAAMTLVNSNLRLVVKIAYEYRTKNSNLLDLIQEGNLGLLRAVRRFDPERGVRVSSYAQWWIRAYILKHLMDNHRLVKVGTTQAQRKLYYNLNKTRDRLRDQGQEPTPKAIARALDVREKDVVEMHLRLNQRDMRLNAPVGEEGSTERGDLMPGDAPMPEDVAASREFRSMFKDRLEAFKSGLEGRDVMIWNERLLSEEPLTLRELAGRFGVSRERVRQLEARIVRNLTAYVREEFADAGLEG